MHKLIPLLTAFCLALVACPPLPPDGPEPAPSAQGGAPGCSGSPCAVTCCHYRRLECEEAQPTAKGSSCVEVCETAADEGIELAKSPSCLEWVTSCDAARACD